MFVFLFERLSWKDLETPLNVKQSLIFQYCIFLTAKSPRKTNLIRDKLTQEKNVNPFEGKLFQNVTKHEDHGFPYESFYFEYCMYCTG